MTIDTMAKLRQVYPPPAALAGLKVLDHLDLHCCNFIALSPFYVISSARADGHRARRCSPHRRDTGKRRRSASLPSGSGARGGRPTTIHCYFR